MRGAAIISALALAMIIAGIAYVMDGSHTDAVGTTTPTIVLPNDNTDARLPIDESKPPTCTITTDVPYVIDWDQQLAFSWRSTNATKILSDYPVEPGARYELPPSGSGTVSPKDGQAVTKPGSGSPDSINFRFTVSNKSGRGACWLSIPIKY